MSVKKKNVLKKVQKYRLFIVLIFVTFFSNISKGQILLLDQLDLNLDSLKSFKKYSSIQFSLESDRYKNNVLNFDYLVDLGLKLKKENIYLFHLMVINSVFFKMRVLLKKNKRDYKIEIKMACFKFKSYQKHLFNDLKAPFYFLEKRFFFNLDLKNI